MKDKYDIIIAGGGMAGTVAAIAAAREGARVLLIERYSALGGMATLGLVQPITMWGCKGKYVLGGLGKALLEKLAEYGEYATTPMSTYGPVCDAEYLKRLLEETVVEAGVDLLYHAWVSGVEQDGSRITGVNIMSKAGTQTISGSVFIDGTGDADLAAFSGVPFEEDTQGITLMFLLSGIDRDKCPEGSIIKEIWEKNKIGYRGLAIFWHPRKDTAFMNVTEVEHHSGLEPESLTAATVECRKQVWQVLEIMQQHVPGFENAYVEQTAPALGVRETRRITGRYQLTEDDVFNAPDFEDTIARASCPVDVHSSADGGKGDYRSIEKSYGIPYRCLTSETVDNLIVTGRPISADHAAHSSLRRMAPGCGLGEAAGLAAVMAVADRNVNTIDIDALRQQIIDKGGIIYSENQEK